MRKIEKWIFQKHRFYWIFLQRGSSTTNSLAAIDTRHPFVPDFTQQNKLESPITETGGLFRSRGSFVLFIDGPHNSVHLSLDTVNKCKQTARGLTGDGSLRMSNQWTHSFSVNETHLYKGKFTVYRITSVIFQSEKPSVSRFCGPQILSFSFLCLIPGCFLHLQLEAVYGGQGPLSGSAEIHQTTTVGHQIARPEQERLEPVL